MWIVDPTLGSFLIASTILSNYSMLVKSWLPRTILPRNQTRAKSLKYKTAQTQNLLKSNIDKNWHATWHELWTKRWPQAILLQSKNSHERKITQNQSWTKSKSKKWPPSFKKHLSKLGLTPSHKPISTHLPHKRLMKERHIRYLKSLQM